MQSSNQFEQRQAEVVRRNETPFAALTLTRSATLAITTAGTVITWQTQTRGLGISWATTDITIPTSGFYTLQIAFQTAAAVTMFTQIVLNTVNLGYVGSTWVASTYHVATHTRHFATGDVIQVRALPSANTTINVNGEGVAAPSPYVHIVQLTAAVP